MSTTSKALPEIASRDEWLAARKELLSKEKELTRVRDAVNAARRRLPMVRIEKDYVFEGSDGPARLIDLFEGRRQHSLTPFFFWPGVRLFWLVRCAPTLAAVVLVHRDERAIQIGQIGYRVSKAGKLEPHDAVICLLRFPAFPARHQTSDRAARSPADVSGSPRFFSSRR